MTALQLALSELKRMTSGFLPKLAIIALTIVPLLYGAFYLYANWDPQANMANLTAALVVEDEGAVDTEGHRQELGKQVATALHESHSFTWQDVATMEEAERGVEKGTYSFAVRIPEDFSASLLSTGNIRPGDEQKLAEQALLEVVTNDANNYTINTFVDRLLSEVHASVSKQVGTETADRFLTSMGLIHTKMSKAADGADQVHEGTSSMKEGTRKLASGTTKLHAGTVDLDTGIGRLKDGQTKLEQGASRLHDGASDLHDGASDLHDGTSELSRGLQKMDARTTTLVSDTQQLADGADKVADADGKLNDSVQEAIGRIRTVPDLARERLVETTDQMVTDGIITRQQADAVLKRYDARQTSPEVLKARKDLDEASKKMQQLADGSRKVADGNRRLAKAMPTLRQGIVDASAGARKLDTGAGQLETGAGKLEDGAQKLETGLEQSLDGVTKLKAGSSKLVTGAHELDQGATKLSEGSTKLDKGASDLAGGLRNGSEQVPHPSEAKKKNVSTVMGDPVAITRVSQAKAATYGAGLAPFFLSLALWVGIFMLVQAMRPITRRALASNARAWRIALGGWIPFWIVSVFQATILGIVVHWVLGLQPYSLPLTWGFMLLATLAFSAIIQGIVALLGTAGKFVVLILLVLQLVASGGTLPWQLTPKPLHVVHALLPMSHVVEGMRRLIYGSDISAVGTHAWALVGYFVFGLSLSIIAAHKHKTWTLKTLQPEIAI